MNGSKPSGAVAESFHLFATENVLHQPGDVSLFGLDDGAKPFVLSENLLQR
jgi:hypothetical protein